MNKLVHVWNEELETLTRLDLSQISSCFELICKKYHTAFSFSAPVLKTTYSPDSISSDLKLVKAHSVASEKAYSSQTRYENALTNNFPRYSVNENSASNDDNSLQYLTSPFSFTNE